MAAESQGPPGDDVREAIHQLKARLADLEAATGALEALRSEQRALGAEIAALERRLDAGAGHESSPEPETPPTDQPASVEATEAATPTPPPLPSLRAARAKRESADPDAAPDAPRLEPVSPSGAMGDSITSMTAAEKSPEAAPAKETFEFKVGTYWLVRIGIVMLLTGLVFLAKYFISSETIPAIAKVAALYVFSFAILGAGFWIERSRESLRSYGQVLTGGGLAAVYFTTYAAHKVPALLVIPSPVLAGILLLVWAGVMVYIADRRHSQTLAVMGVLLAYYTLLIDSPSLFSLWAALILAAGALLILLRNRWMGIGFVSLAGTYLAFAYWRYPELLSWLRGAAPAVDSFWPEYGFLVCYWVVFTAAAFLSKGIDMDRRSGFAGLNNAAFLVLFGLGMGRYFPDQFWIFTLASGAVFLVLSELADRRFGRGCHLANFYLTGGLVLVTLGFLIKLSGFSLALVLAAESSVFLVIAMLRRNRIIEVGAYLAAMGAVGYTLASEAVAPGGDKLFFLELPGDIPAVAALGQFFFLAFNAWWVRHRASEKVPKLNSAGEVPVFDPCALFFVGLAVTAAIVGTFWDVTEEYRALALMGAGLVCAAAGTAPRIRLAELAPLGQAFTGLAMVLFLAQHADLPGMPEAALWQSVVLLGGVLALTHWSRHPMGLPGGRELKVGLEWTFAVFFSLGLVLAISHHDVDFRSWLYLGGLLALGQLAYGKALRLPALAVLSQGYHLVAFFAFLTLRSSPWMEALPLVFLLVNIQGVDFLRRGASTLDRTREGLIEAGLCLMRALSLIVFVLWTLEHLAEPWQPVAAGLAGCAVMALAVWRRDAQRLAFALLLGGTAVLQVLGPVISGNPYGVTAWYLACLTPLLMQQILRRLAAGSPADEDSPTRFFSISDSFVRGLHPVLVAAGLGLTWLVLSRDVAASPSGFSLTASWSLLASLVFAAGVLLRERAYRIGSLVILAAALVRILAVDVWSLEPVARIVSFIAIGLVLLVLGYVYTRFQEKLRRIF